MPRLSYIPKSKTKIGKGRQMDPDTLRRALIKALQSQPSQLERDGFSHGTALRLCRKVKALNLTLETIGSITSKELHALYYKKEKPVRSSKKIMPDFDVLQDVYNRSQIEAKTPSQKKLSLTRKSVIELKYFNDPNNKALVESGEYSFFSFSRVYQMWRSRNKKIKTPVYIKEHEMGAEAEYDFTGVRLPYVVDGTTHYATFIVAVLTGSRYIYAKAIANQSQAVVCDAIADSFRYFGGCPHVIRIDNFKAAVKEASYYQGQLTDEMLNFKSFFNIGVFTCRSAHPTDKAPVEAAVKYFTRYALSIANNHIKEGHTFRSLDEINAFISPYLNNMNESKIRGMKSSRKELFTIEKHILQQPASWDYKYFESFMIKVPENARFTLNEHQYAIPPKWIGEKITVLVTNSTIKFLNLEKPIACYARKDGIKGLSANSGFVPENHLIYDIFNIRNQEELLLNWAQVIGEHVKEWCAFQLKQNKNVYADKVRYVHKFLTIVKANKAHYSTFNRCVKENMYSSFSLITCHRLIKIWNTYDKPAVFHYDEVFNNETYISLGKAMIYGQCDIMLWPLSTNGSTSLPSSQPNTVNTKKRARSKEFLNGHAVYDERFYDIKKMLL